LRPQGKEIVRTWLYYTLLKCYQLTGMNIFENVWVHYHVVDEKGEKMSKSKGNGVDPQEVLNKLGAEPFRLWTAAEGDITSTDLRCSVARIDGAGKTLTKLWNVVRFASGFPSAATPKKLAPLDAWIRHETAQLVSYCDERYAAYDFHGPMLQIRHFLWDTFASHYLEMVKARAYNRDNIFSKEEQDSALSTIHHCVDTLLLLLAPITPFITAKLYSSLHGKSVHDESFPVPEKTKEPSFTTATVEELNGVVWKAKKDAGLSLRAPLEALTIPKELEPIKKELAITHGAKKVLIGEKVAVSLAAA
jgi:valyl-tRNA synthetase